MSNESDRETRCDDAGTAPRVARADFATLPTLDKLERTPTGGIRVPARVSRTGVLLYPRKDGKGSLFREYRPESEAFAPASLSSLEDAVVTVGHPAGSLVTPQTARQYGVGHVRGGGRREDRFVGADLVVLDAFAIDSIGAKTLVDLSSGYTCRLELTPGISPDGEPYDAIQRDVRYNHVALLPAGAGRAGRDVALRLDGVEVSLDAPTEKQPTEMRADAMTETINGKTYTVGSPEWAAANALRCARLDELEGEKKSFKEKLDELSAKRDELKAQLDAANASIESLKKEVGEAGDESKMDSRVAARATLVAQARELLGGDVKLDGKSSDQIRREVITKLDGADALLDEGKPRPEAMMRVYFDARMRSIGTNAGATVTTPRKDSATGGSAGPTDVSEFHVPPSMRRKR